MYITSPAVAAMIRASEQTSATVAVRGIRNWAACASKEFAQRGMQLQVAWLVRIQACSELHYVTSSSSLSV